LNPQKSKKSKAPKKAKDSALTLKLAGMQRRQKEVARVLQLKHEILIKSELSYMEYMELRAELERLNALRETFARRLDKLKQQAK
ncbi:hypothetical protein KR222_006272, partial [Zaprionus bogoriensis]